MTDVMGFILTANQSTAYPWLNDRTLWITIFTVVVVAPLSFFKKLDALKFTSSLSIVFVLCITVMIFMYSLGLSFMDPCLDFAPNVEKDHLTCSGPTEPSTDFSRVVQVVTIFIFR